MLREAYALFLGILTACVAGVLLYILLPMLLPAQSVLMRWFVFVVLTTAVFAGGFVSGRVARRRPVALGFVVGCFALGGLFSASGMTFHSVFQALAGVITIISFGLLGAAAAELGSKNTRAV